ncbi:carboxymuconolactone decarboxylase family protein [Amycolatopsis acidicola]|uniref:Carboxymuconolactone decarboxylase family protein n=1 Tax=Amycolatopsis acidicola TaxID=2596893 RepID=A0A5N0V982_9PSEU|nr:carboxymuconolactone decarboxylase family protein [Amycolatopsis acidicola]KAA9162078.1 carboxymuconolactone decarboxylase family protein [Amycolatopsis acidicola]
MARLDYVVEGSEVADRIRARRGGRLTALDGMLLHSPPFADGWNNLLGAIRGNSTLPGDIRELAILRVAELNGAEYEWSAHEPVAKEEGMTTDQLAALRVGGDTGALDARQRATVAYTDAMTREIAVGDELFGALGEHFDEQQVVELTVTVGAYNMVSRFLVALEVGKE